MSYPFRETTPLNTWNTPLPRLDEVQRTSHSLAEQGYDVHTVTITLNGQSGEWDDVEFGATDTDMADVVMEFTLERHGSLERI